MPIVTGDLARLNFGGRMSGGEEWSCSIMFAAVAESTPIVATADGFKPALSTWFAAPNSWMHKGAELDYVKFNRINRVTGKYVSTGTSVESVFSPSVVTSGTGVYTPNQLTQVITLHSDLTRGRASKGRFYPPNSAMNDSMNITATDGRMSTGKTMDMATTSEDLLIALKAAGEGYVPVVWSHLAQVAHAVERVSVGRVVDTQRRRRSSLAEDRQYGALGV